MRKPDNKGFDIRQLFVRDFSTRDPNEEELEVYDSIEEKKRKKRGGQKILSEYELEVLKNMDIEATKSDVEIPVARRIEVDTMDANDTSVDNKEWRIHVLKNLIAKNSSNAEARIELSKLLVGEDAKRVLLDGGYGMNVWRELIDKHYTPSMFEDALKVNDGDEEFYERLFLKETNPKALRVGIEKHPRSSRLRIVLANTMKDDMERQRFLYDSVVETEDARLFELFMESKAEPRSVSCLYTLMKEKNVYFDELFLHMLDTAEFPDVLKDLFDLGFIKTLCVISKCERLIELPPQMLDKEEILGYIKTICPTPMTPLPPHLRSLFVSVSKHNLHNDKTFISCYSLAKQYFLDVDFINSFFLMNPKRYFVDLLKAKECWKLFVRNGDFKLFRKTDKILANASNYYKKEMKMFILARSKIYFRMGDYAAAYSVIPKKMRTIKRYCILAQMSLHKALESLEKDLFDYKHYLLYAELLVRGGQSPDKIYDECMRKYPDNPKIGLAYLRHLKTKDLERALELSDILVKKFASDECVWFERFVIFRKLKRISLSVLYNSRKHLKSHMIEAEIKYYENKEMSEESSYFNYFIYKRMYIKECNRDGICDVCINALETRLRNMIMKYQDDGDNYLIYYCVVGNFEKVKEMIEFFDPQRGHYWVRVRKVRNIQDKLNEGVGILRFDLLN